MSNLNDGKVHKIRFCKGKLYLDGIQIAGEGIASEKEVTFEFQTNTIPSIVSELKDNSVLEVNVHDTVTGKAVGPGQL